MSQKLLLRPTEAAEALSISRAMVYRLIASGEIGSVRIGTAIRVPRAALEDYIARLQEADDAAA